MTTDPTLFRPLSRRPQATTVTVKDLIQKVQAGEVRIPRFQRPLRWSGKNVLDFIDSIWRGYPVGSLLLWKRPAEAETLLVGGARLQVPARADAWWVVDGQQRITALAASLLDLDHGGDRRWVLRFDPEHEAFLLGPPPPQRIGLDVPLSVLGDLRRLGRWLRDCALEEEMIDRVEDAQQRILDYSIPAYVVETSDEEALRAVFARLNSTGARMRAEEVFQALLGAPSATARPSLDLDALQKGCDVDGFGQPARSEILKAVLAMSGLDPTRRLEDLGDLRGLVSPEDAAEALSRTVEFLAKDCGIPHESLIPYPVVFFILARWFHIHPNPAPATRTLLARWVWRGAVTGVHERAAVSKMREQVRDIQPGEESGSLDRLLRRIGPPPAGHWGLEKFNHKSARSRIECLALLSLAPRDRFGFVSLGDLVCGRVAREIFVKSGWKSLPNPDRDLARSAANRVLLADTHSGLQAELRRWDPTKHSEALASHLIDGIAFEALVRKDIPTFLRRRAAALVPLVDRFLHERAAWDEPTLRPLVVYLDAELVD
ncbi:MAG: DUF262 domain-containing protein [Myxococcales bacterium]|jgi:hypothetical protein